MLQNIEEFISKNQDTLNQMFTEGKSVIVIGGPNKGKSSVIGAIKNLWQSNIPTENLYEACIDVETIMSSRILVDCREKISYMVADFDSVKEMERYLSTDFNVAQYMSEGGKHLGLLVGIYPKESEEPVTYEIAIQLLSQMITPSQLESLKASGICVISCDRHRGHVILCEDK